MATNEALVFAQMMALPEVIRGRRVGQTDFEFGIYPMVTWGAARMYQR